jgi:PKD domain
LIITTKTAAILMMLLPISLSFLCISYFLQVGLAQEQGEQPLGQQIPIAVTDQDQMVSEGDLVTLNGSGSFDPDGEIVSYAWGIEDSDDDAPSVLLERRDTSVATFTAPKVVGDVNANSYLFELTVTDNDGLKATNTSKVVVVKGASPT